MTPIEDRFWAKVDTTGECWVWTATTNAKGYGRFWATGRLESAHRWIYERLHGALSAEDVVCHRCDRPSCVRPDHLFAGSLADNAADMMRKDRHSRARTGSSRFTGVGMHHQVVAGRCYSYWRARLRVDGVGVYLGQFATEYEAAAAYDRYVLEHDLGRPLNVLGGAA